MVCGRKLLWNRVLLVQKVAAISRAYDLVVIVVVGWFIISLYNSDSEEQCFSLARMCIMIKRLNRWSLLLCSGITSSPNLVLASSIYYYYTIPPIDISYKSYRLL